MDIIIINKFYFLIKFNNIVSKIQTIKYKYSDFQSSFFFKNSQYVESIKSWQVSLFAY